MKYKRLRNDWEHGMGVKKRKKNHPFIERWKEIGMHSVDILYSTKNCGFYVFQMIVYTITISDLQSYSSKFLIYKSCLLQVLLIYHRHLDTRC
jgi:hypothetical protein